MAPRKCPGMFFNLLVISAIALVTITGLMWIGQTATWHRDAADDLMHQLVRSMDTLLLASLQASIKLVKEAHNMWSFTGLYVHHPLLSLSELGSWLCRCTSIHFIQHERLVHWTDGRLLFEHKALNAALWYCIWLRTEREHHNRWCSSPGPKLLQQCRHCVFEIVLCWWKYNWRNCRYLWVSLLSELAENGLVGHYDPRYTQWYENGLRNTKDGSDNPSVMRQTIPTTPMRHVCIRW